MVHVLLICRVFHVNCSCLVGLDGLGGKWFTLR